MIYNRFTKKTMPPIDNYTWFMLWRGIRDDDGGFPVLAKRVKHGDDVFIWFQCGAGPRILEPGEYRDCRWAVIDRPQEGAQHVERV
jgi:hypothetical protein